ncbi:mitochondrial 37S ribosomal protein [Saccharomycopsis crataegensis]|uniref:Small ribosomal subunit protein bS18m n=1 Tax=Saccharomycopsis crataegensis TaxID=43959 RepID=A0AAV5QQJ7_9ASCO|nr:mitochondrial 37S ribosomal protein [Saccharomycopsis crataegensis]
MADSKRVSRCNHDNRRRMFTGRSLQQSSRLFSTSVRLLNEEAPKFSKWGAKGAQSSSQSLNQLHNVLQAEKTRAENEEEITINPNIQVRLQDTQVYDPFDFTFAKYKLVQRKRQQNRGANDQYSSGEVVGLNAKHAKDAFKRINLNPMSIYTFGPLLANYVSETGRIYHRDVNIGLTAKTHKKLTRAINRARAAGIMSNTSRSSFDTNTNFSGMLDDTVRAYHENPKHSKVSF